jgi:hypothetical protein
VSFASPLNDTQPVDPVDPKRVSHRAQKHDVSPKVVRVGDAFRLAFLACYVISATVSQIAGGALIVYLISG